MMKPLFVGVAAVAMSSTLAMAQDGGVGTFSGTFSGNVAATTDYVFRGYSQSDEHPAFQPSLNWDSGAGFHLNFWASNIDFNDGGDADIETDLTAGYAGSVDKLSYDFGAVYYLYPGTAKNKNYNYWEAYTTFGYDLGVAKLNTSLYYSPNFFGGIDDAWAIQGGFSAPLADKLTFDAQLGKQMIKKKFGTDYTYWNAGLTYSFPWVDVGLRYHDTNVAVCAGLCGARGVLTLTKNF